MGGRNYISSAITVSTLARKVSELHSISEREAHALLSGVFEMITGAIKSGRRVHLTGLGTFTTRNWKAKEQHTTLGMMTVPARAYPAFRPAKHLKALPVREPLP
jgi:nucleoid DNA-binding protein